ncbi:helix-turn-helix domain-containing protein [Mucilaginibacter sp. E4BP6]|uniref:helix-turn-helix transcriptional regulator n=1 Tax=Mucilaginibacter sp. E4BP6 TaxID=2723089 RepID=UPI0015C6B9C2|nr:helix-turn-helix transcriptional regulator [Mucilaginibacter sp. E4BP6]NYE65044.1 AraC-like DNA-binding protein [Mucilaginibacter sp. E4BP6]
MYYSDTETVIPKFQLEPDTRTGNKMLRMEKSDCSMSMMRSDFLRPHRKDYYFFCLVKQGSSRHWIDMMPYTLKADTFYFTVPNQVQLKEEAEPLTDMILAFTEEFLALEGNSSLKQLPIIQNKHNGHDLSLTPADVIFIEDILEKMYAEYIVKNNWQHGMVTAYVQVLMICLSRLYSEQYSSAKETPDRLMLKKYLSKIEGSYTQTHEVTAYADMLNISAGHLSEVVKEQSGKPAIAHIHERLILEAKRLLFHTEHSIKEIAFQLGFEDASYFNRFFKRLVNDTPVKYRTTTREMYQ